MRIVSAVTLVASVLVLLVLAPFSWGGGGGPPGNRYFLSLYPVLFFLAPPLGAPAAVSTFLGGMLFVAPWIVTPFTASKFTWAAVDTPALRLLPIELTMVDDLPVRLSAERARIPLWGASTGARCISWTTVHGRRKGGACGSAATGPRRSSCDAISR